MEFMQIQGYGFGDRFRKEHMSDSNDLLYNWVVTIVIGIFTMMATALGVNVNRRLSKVEDTAVTNETCSKCSLKMDNRIDGMDKKLDIILEKLIKLS
jgi:hypothetical protein